MSLEKWARKWVVKKKEMQVVLKIWNDDQTCSFEKCILKFTKIKFLTYLMSKNPKVWQRALLAWLWENRYSHALPMWLQNSMSMTGSLRTPGNALTLWPSNSTSRSPSQSYHRTNLKKYLLKNIYWRSLYPIRILELP